MDIAGKLTSLVTLVGSTYVTYSVLRDRFWLYIFELDNFQTIHDTNENMASQTTQDNTSHALSHLATTIFYLFYNHMFTLLLFMIMATVFVLFIAIVMFKLYKRIILHRDEETQQNSRHTPPASFNNNVNVTLWLKDVERYFESHSINNNAHKLRYLLEHLDECNRNLVKTKIKTDRLETYDEASVYLLRLCGNGQHQGNKLQEYATRKQKPNESIAQYYRELKQLSIEAMPKDTEKNRKHHLRRTFVLGLRDESIRRALISFSNDVNKTNEEVVNEAVSLEDAKTESTSIENNKKSIAIINNIETEEQCNSDNDNDTNSECQVNFANTNYRKTRFSTTVQNGMADKSQTKVSQYNKQPVEPSQERVTTGNNHNQFFQRQPPIQEATHMPAQQQPIQQLLQNSYHQYHQSQNQNQQQWNGYAQNRVKPCYACFQYGHREYNCPDDQAFERYTAREIKRMHERRQQGNNLYQQPQQPNAWQQTQPQQLQGNSMALNVEHKPSMQNNNTYQMTQSKTSATPASTNTRQ